MKLPTSRATRRRSTWSLTGKLYAFSLLLPILTQAQSINQTETTDAFIKVWGLLKYYHPVAATGALNWDSVFVARLPEFNRVTTQAALNQKLTDWITSLGDLSGRPLVSMDYDKTDKNVPHDWLTTTPALSASTRALLTDVIGRRQTGAKHYVKIQSPGVAAVQHEPLYETMTYPAEAYRLLALARYWNVITYFYPYRYLTDQPWNEVLPAMIPLFQEAPNAVMYLRALRRLTASVNDSHSRIMANPHGVKFDEKLTHVLPVQATIIDGKLVVTRLLNGVDASSLGLQRGDAIVQIDQQPVAELAKQYAAYIGASNQAVVNRDVGEYLLWYPKNTVSLTVERGGTTYTRLVQLAPAGTYSNKSSEETAATYTLLEPRIGYVPIKALTPKNVKRMLRDLRDTDGLIIDLRQYPGALAVYKELCYRLATKLTPFTQFQHPNMSYPGTFRSSLLYCGRNRAKPPYGGKLVLLVNERTQSMGEFFAMALQTLPNVTVIGSQTAGTDGDVTLIPLPGGYQVFMTGLGVYYADGRPTQRVGIKVDIACRQTIEGLQSGRDDILNRAVQFIQQEK